MLDADERQEWGHSAGKLAEMADIMFLALESTLLPRNVVEQMMLVWWEQAFRPKFEMPDFRALFSSGDEE